MHLHFMRMVEVSRCVIDVSYVNQSINKSSSRFIPPMEEKAEGKKSCLRQLDWAAECKD